MPDTTQPPGAQVLVWPVIARPIPRPEAPAVSPSVSGLKRWLDKGRTTPDDTANARVAAMARQTKTLIGWTGESVEALGRDWTIEHLRAALADLERQTNASKD